MKMRWGSSEMSERMTAARYNEMANKKPSGGTKRVAGVVPTVFDGIKFHSTKEASKWADLLLLKRSGQITSLERQVPFQLHGRDGPILTPTGRVARYFADYMYVDWELDGIRVIEDSKGYQTEISILKLAIMAAQNQKVTLT
jgi:hypothetical protein